MDPKKVLKPSIIDKAIGVVSPKYALKRMGDRIKFNAALQGYNYAYGTAGYAKAGDYSNRALRAWGATNLTADGDTLTDLVSIRASSRDLYMNTPLSPAVLRRVRTNVVGSGLTLQSRIDRNLLGLTPEQADEWERNTEREFDLWASCTDADITGVDDFYSLQALAFLSVLMNGDAFAVLPMAANPSSRCPYKLRVQLLEADQVQTPSDKTGSTSIKGGIAVDSKGRHIAYYVVKPSPTSELDVTAETYINTSLGFKRIPKYGRKSGRLNVIHLLEKERIGQKRGLPLLANVVTQLKQISRLGDAELMAAVVTSFFTAFVHNTPGGGGLQGQYTEDETVLDDSDDGTSGSDATHPDNNLYEMGQGNIVDLGDQEKVTFADPNRPNDSYAPFFEALAKQIGAASEVPYEVVMSSFTSSYSASRAALLEAWKFFKTKRNWISKKFCKPIYEAWLSEAVALGRVKAPGFFEDAALRKAWCSSVWSGPGQGQIDPVKETKGAELRIANNLSTYEDEYVAINGGNWEASIERRSRENRILQDNGLLTQEDGNNE